MVSWIGAGPMPPPLQNVRHAPVQRRRHAAVAEGAGVRHDGRVEGRGNSLVDQVRREAVDDFVDQFAGGGGLLPNEEHVEPVLRLQVMIDEDRRRGGVPHEGPDLADALFVVGIEHEGHLRLRQRLVLPQRSIEDGDVPGAGHPVEVVVHLVGIDHRDGLSHFLQKAPEGQLGPNGVPVRTKMSGNEKPIVLSDQRKYVVEHAAPPGLPWARWRK